MDKQTNEEQRSSNRPKTTIFGFLTKRSRKVEPQPIKKNRDSIDSSSCDDDGGGGGGGGDAGGDGDGDGINKHHHHVDISFAKCSPSKRSKKVHENHSISNNNSNTINSTTTEQIPCYKCKLHKNNNNNNNNNNNRFSNRFSLCCSIDEKTHTPPPPVSVRYNSLPDPINTNLQQIKYNNLESNSAPDTPFNGGGKQRNSENSSPSIKSVQSCPSSVDILQQQQQQPRSIAITACRSRLRLKLLPPPSSSILSGNKVLDSISSNINGGGGGQIVGNCIDEQHSSSPNISVAKNDVKINAQNSRSKSHEGIQAIHRPLAASMDSLARQSLMAAQVLNLIPTEKARQRNYLAGRLAVNSLLGLGELTRVLPTKEIRIFVGTWNMNGQIPPKQMNDFILPTGVEHVPDLLAIGTQESCSERFEWEVILQETLGPTHILLHAASLGTLHLAIFLRRDLIWFCSLPEDSSMSVRPGTAFRTKGAVAISFALFGTSMLFVTSHLTAHQQKVKERVQDVKRIINALDLPRNLSMRYKNKDVTQNFDSVFWCGDLNFRLSEPREKLLKWIENTKFPLPSHLPHGYMHTDQLSSVLADGAAFKGFMEANITFPPTYKYDPGTQHFDTSSKQRAPAYTDRILYKYKSLSIAVRRGSTIGGQFLSQTQSSPVECLAYDSVPSIISSDHKPVWALFRSTIRPGIDTIPLAAGLFNRDVYLEGMRRRLNNTQSGSSAVCSIQ